MALFRPPKKFDIDHEALKKAEEAYNKELREPVDAVRDWFYHTAEKAVFPFREVAHGPMAEFLGRPPSPPKDSQAPRGRSRTGSDFFAPPSVGVWERA